MSRHDAVFENMRRLHNRGRDCRGLVVDSDGVSFGPDWELVRRDRDEYRVIDTDEIASVFRYAFDGRGNAGEFSAQIGRIVRALNDGELTKAQILGLQILLGPLSDRDLWRLDVASALLKAGYDPNQPRDDKGWWSDEGGRSSSEISSNRDSDLPPARDPNLVPVQFAMPFPPPLFPGVFGGNTQPKPKDDEVFPYGAPGDETAPANDDAQTRADEATDDNQPKLCPPPTEENIKRRSERALAYQEQISGLPRGYDVELNRVRYDGCDARTGNMLEAKGPGLVWMFLRGSWIEKAKLYSDTMNQAAAQSKNSGGRIVEWHFADKIVGDFFKERFRTAGYDNIVVFDTPAKVLKIASCFVSFDTHAHRGFA